MAPPPLIDSHWSMYRLSRIHRQLSIAWRNRHGASVRTAVIEPTTEACCPSVAGRAARRGRADETSPAPSPRSPIRCGSACSASSPTPARCAPATCSSRSAKPAHDLAPHQDPRRGRTDHRREAWPMGLVESRTRPPQRTTTDTRYLKARIDWRRSQRRRGDGLLRVTNVSGVDPRSERAEIQSVVQTAP